MSKKRIRATPDYEFQRDDRGHLVVIPLFILPATAEAYEQMLRQAHAAVTAEFTSNSGPPGLEDYARAALRAIGITPPKKGRT